MVACIISQPPNRNNVIEEMIDSTTAISTINLVLQSTFSNLFSNIDIVNLFYFKHYLTDYLTDLFMFIF